VLITDSIKTEYLDNAHYDIGCAFPPAGYGKLDDIIITDGSGLVPYVLKDGELKTQEFQLTCIVTAEQDKLLQKLYAATMHPGYVDERYPVRVSWGHESARIHKACYLKAYNPPESVDYASPAILQATLTLRPI